MGTTEARVAAELADVVALASHQASSSEASAVVAATVPAVAVVPLRAAPVEGGESVPSTVRLDGPVVQGKGHCSGGNGAPLTLHRGDLGTELPVLPAMEDRVAPGFAGLSRGGASTRLVP